MEEKDNQNTTSENNRITPKPKKIFKGKTLSAILAIFGLIVVISLIGIGAALAGRIWDPKWNPFRPKASKDSPVIYKNFQETFQLPEFFKRKNKN